jgi:hypothetical protein
MISEHLEVHIRQRVTYKDVFIYGRYIREWYQLRSKTLFRVIGLKYTWIDVSAKFLSLYKSAS